MRELVLSNNKGTALVDDEDYDRLLEFTWTHGNKTIYRTIILGIRTVSISLAREIMQNRFQLFDHIDRNYLNNQKSNLRSCTKQQNSFNVSKYKGLVPVWKGIGKSFRTNKPWRARLGFNGKNICLGNFTTQIEAALAYNAAAKKYFGEFAVLNII